jgi:NPCBM/NEW2 domain
MTSVLAPRASGRFSKSLVLAVLALLGLVLGPLGGHSSGQVKAANRNAAMKAARQQAQQQKPGEAGPPRGAVHTLDADRFDGPILALANGQLSIDSDPPRTIPLDEVDRIEMGTAAAVVLVWVGQDNHDGAQASGTAGGTGIQDIHVECRGIPVGRHLNQIVISGVIGGVVQVWLLNPEKTPFWRIENIRPNNSTTTNFYLEPPAADCFEQTFDVVLSFDDNSTIKSKLTATTHTDAALKVAKEEGTPAKGVPPEPLVFLVGDETIHAHSLEIGAETLTVKQTNGKELKIPLAEVRGIWLGGNKPAQRKKFDEKLKTPGEKDWALIRARGPKDKAGAENEGEEKTEGEKPGEAKPAEAPAAAVEGQAVPADGNAEEKAVAEAREKLEKADKERQAKTKAGNNKADGGDDEKSFASVDGSVQGIADGKLSLVVGEETRKVAMARVQGLVMAAHPAPPPPTTFHQIFELGSGEKMAGQLTAVKPDVLEIHTRYGADLELPRGEVRAITCRNGRATYLSDIEPTSVEEVAYFDRALGYHRDQGLSGGPLAVRGTTYRKGLAVHSRCVLTYQLDGRYEMFRARVGFEDGSPLGGSIACRVLADDRELFANGALRYDAEPISLKLDLAGAKQLILEVDFGESQNIGDRIVWGAARVVRGADPTAAPAVAAVAQAPPAESQPAAPDTATTPATAPAAVPAAEAPATAAPGVTATFGAPPAAAPAAAPAP